MEFILNVPRPNRWPQTATVLQTLDTSPLDFHTLLAHAPLNPVHCRGERPGWRALGLWVLAVPLDDRLHRVLDPPSWNILKGTGFPRARQHNAVESFLFNRKQHVQMPSRRSRTLGGTLFSATATVSLTQVVLKPGSFSGFHGQTSPRGTSPRVPHSGRTERTSS